MATLSCSHCGATIAATLRACPDCGVAVPGAPADGAPKQIPLPVDGARVLHTEVAIQALDLAEAFDRKFADLLPGFRAELAKPGMSTAGGKQSRQHITLYGGGGVSVVVGGFDRAASVVELRSFQHVAAAYRQRFRTGFPIRETVYKSFVVHVARFFHDDEVVVRVDVDPPGSAAQGRAVGSPTWVWLVILALAIVVAAGAAILIFDPGSTPAQPPTSAWPRVAGP